MAWVRYNISYNMKKIINLFDKIEDKVRGLLSHHPFVYAFVGAVGVVLLWRGIWHTTDTIFYTSGLASSTSQFLDGPLSILLGSIILLITGVFVSSFVGNRLILSGLTGEKKLTDKTLDEIKKEEDELKGLEKKGEEELKSFEKKVEATLNKIEEDISEIKQELK